MKFISLGIDLGTTNSAIAYCQGGKSMTYEILDMPNSKNNGIVPSCVKYVSKDICVVGVSSYQERWKPSVVYSMKRHMVEGDNYRHKVIAEDGSEFEVSPIDVGSEVIKHLKKYAEDYLGVDGKEVVAKYTITVPAYFNEVARYNTIQAGVRAGIPEENIVLINEPTAAALSYGSRGKKLRERVLVYDLGGGTFDIAVLDITKDSDGKPKFTVRTCAGADDLGGDDLDNEIADLIISKCCAKLQGLIDEKKISLKVDRSLFSEVSYKKRIFDAESCKKGGRTTTVTVPLSDIDLGDDVINLLGEEYIKINILDKDIRSLSDKVLVSKTTKIVDTLLTDLDTSSSNKMILIGGSTKGNELIEALEEYYPDIIINNTSDPDRSVAIGASIYSEMNNSGESDRLQDVIQLPIGVLSVDERGRSYVNKVIRQNSRIPTSTTKSYKTLTEDQDVLTVKVYQGRSSIPEDCTYLGELVVEGLREFQKEKVAKLESENNGTPLTESDRLLSIDINLSVNVSGCLKAMVKINNHLFEGVINRLSAGSKGTNSKYDSIKRRQIANIKLIVPENEVEAVLQEYGRRFESGIKEASAFLQEVKNKYELGTTSLFS